MPGLRSLGHRGHIRGDVLERERFPRREQKCVVGEEVQIVDEIFGLTFAGHHGENRPVEMPSDAGQHDGARGRRHDVPTGDVGYEIRRIQLGQRSQRCGHEMEA
jgi:hypothetical protein